jgi:tRNA pseudouridine55 synthase
MNHDKEYRFTLRFGQTTDTMDAEGRVLQERPVPELSGQRIRELMAAFSGPQQQTPPMYSAVKIDGQPLHRAARRGQDVERPLRAVVIHAFELEDWTPPFLTASVRCTKGTYVRVLAHDLGEAAGCGAHVTALRRVRSGEFSVEHALPLATVLAMSEDELGGRLIPLREALSSLVAIGITPEQARCVLCGQDLQGLAAADPEAAAADAGSGSQLPEEPTVLTDNDGRALALAVRQGDNWHPIRVFPGAFEKTTCISASFHQNPVTGG